MRMRRFFQSSSSSKGGLLYELQSRGLLFQSTINDQNFFSSNKNLKIYAGFDPTANSLHLGNLLVIVGLLHFARAGIKPVCLIGGATGMIGDPSGKNSERELLSEEIVRENALGIERILRKLFRDYEFEVVNNADWYGNMNVVEYLRDVGKYFRVGSMIAKDSVKNRMGNEESGISFTEFAYQTLQGYDFYELNRKFGVSGQIGGSDQWGNITAGCELIRKKSVVEASEKSSVFGITVPLLTTASGAKFGKSEGNAFWLSKEKTSPYTLYQYISNLGDEDALKLIKMLTFIPLEGLDEISREHTSNPEKRLAQRVLAKELITFIHEESDYNNAKQVSEMLFGHANTSDFKISAEEFSSICEEAGVAIHSMKKSEFFDKSPKEIASLVKLASSQSESRKLIMNGGLYINNQRVEISEMNRKLSLDDCFCDGSLCLIRSGRKKFSLVKIR